MPLVQDDQQAEPKIYQHSMKAEWGRGTLLGEAENKREILWEDERVRSIHQSHWDRLVEVELSDKERAELDDQLRKKRQTAEAAAKRAARRGRGASRPKKPPLAWAHQLDIFARKYAAGFQDPTYLKAERGIVEGEEPAQKAAAIALARELFARDAMEAKLSSGKGAEIYDNALQIPATVKNLLHFVEAGKLKSIPDDAKPEFGAKLFDLLHGDGPLEARFDAWVGALPMDPRPTWTVATIFQSFFAPDEHVFVKPTFWLKQAAIIEKEVPYDPTPDGNAYVGFLDVAQSTRKRLEQAGLQPVDLIDVYTFIWRTLSPKAIKTYLKAKA